jgi:hypothetical protein
LKNMEMMISMEGREGGSKRKTFIRKKGLEQMRIFTTG